MVNRLEGKKKSEGGILKEAETISRAFEQILETDPDVSKLAGEHGLNSIQQMLKNIIENFRTGTANGELVSLFSEKVNDEMVRVFSWINNNSHRIPISGDYISKLRDWNINLQNFIFDTRLSYFLNSDHSVKMEKELYDFFKQELNIFRNAFIKNIAFLYTDPQGVSDEELNRLLEEFDGNMENFAQKFKNEESMTNIVIDYEKEFKTLTNSFRRLFFDLDENQENIIKPGFSINGVNMFMYNLSQLSVHLLKIEKTTKFH